MSLRKYWIVVITILLISSCVSVSQEEFASINFGSPPENYENDIKNLMSQHLKDPKSAIYRFGKPEKGVAQEGWAVGNEKKFGYIVGATINAKNSYGGYTGAKPYFFLFSEGNLFNVSELHSLGRVKFYEEGK